MRYDARADHTRRDRSVLAPPLIQTAIAICGVLLGGCASAPNGAASTSIDTRGGDSDLIERLAARERRQTSGLAPRDIAPPPGVDPHVLAPTDEPDARLPLAEVLAELYARTQPPPAQRDDLRGTATDPEDQREALRFYARGRAAAADGKDLIALNELQKAFELDPQSTSIMRELARTHLRTGRSGLAIGLYTAILDRDPDDDEARFRVAIVLADRRDFERAAGMLSYAWRHDAQPGPRYPHDPGAAFLASSVLFQTLSQSGYERAAIEAGQRAAGVTPLAMNGSAYQVQIRRLYRQRAEIWRAIGDAHTRLREYEQALDAYGRAASLPLPDPGALFPRVMHCHLAMGRPYHAQRELLRALEAGGERIGDREIRLCQYLAEHARPVDTLARAIRDLYDDDADSPVLVRAAAAVLPPAESRRMLREFIDRQPRDVGAVAELLHWTSERDLPSALSLATELVEAHPDLARRYVDRFVGLSPRTGAYLDALEQLPDSPARAIVESLLLLGIGARGPAWDVGQAALGQWPDDDGIRLLEVLLAAALGEPALVEDTVQRTEDIATGWAGAVRGRALLSIGEAEAAVNVLVGALGYDDHRYECYTELGAAKMHLVYTATDAVTRRLEAEEAVEAGDRALAIDDTRDEAYDILINLYRPAGELEDPTLFRTVTDRLLSTAPDSRLYAFLAAEEAVRHQRYQAGLDRLLNLYSTDVTDDASLAKIIEAWRRMDRVDDAIDWIEEQLEMRPGDVLLLSHWTALKLALERSDDVIARLAPMLEADDRQHAIADMLSAAHRHRGDAEEAVRYAEHHLLVRPVGVRRESGLAAAYQQAGMNDRSLPHLRWILENADGRESYLYSALQIAQNLREPDEGGLRLVVELAMAILKRTPESSMGVYEAALLGLAKLGAVDDAFDDLIAQAIESAPFAADSSQGRTDRWLRLAQRMINADSLGAASRVLRGRLYAVAPLEPAAAHQFLWATIAVDAARRTPGETIGLVSDLKTREQLPPLLNGDRRQVTMTEVLFEASTIYTQIGDTAGSEMLLRRVLALEPDHAMAMNNLGYARLVAGDGLTRQERAWIEQAYAMEPNSASIVDTVGWLRYMDGRFEDLPDDAPVDDPRGAVSMLRAALLMLDEPSGEVLDHLGDALYRAGDVEGALDAWERAIAVIEDPLRRQAEMRGLAQLQQNWWRLVVGNVEAMYDRDRLPMLERAREKTAAVKEGRTPPVTPTFQEQQTAPEHVPE